MISLRQHVTSLVGVFLALAVGIAIGGGPLAGREDPEPPAHANATGPVAAEPTDDVARFADAFAGEGAARLYADGLAGHATAILMLPGVAPGQVKELQAQIVAAGGPVTGIFELGDGLLDPGQESLVETTSTQLATQLADPRIEADAPTYERMGQLLGLAVATTQTSSVRADPAAAAVRQAVTTAGLVSPAQDVRNAPLVLVVLPAGDPGTGSSPGGPAALSGLMSGLAHNAAGVVVVGDRESADGGALATLRESDLIGPVSTVDGIDTTIGLVTTVLALEAVAAGTTGSFGASGADGVVPLR